MTQKLYCYVDETGQDTQGEVFLVAAVVVTNDRDGLIARCEAVEAATGKGRAKWIKTQHRRRLAYIEAILSAPSLWGHIYLATFRDTRDYQSCTLTAIAQVLKAYIEQDYRATILIDGLPRQHERAIAAHLHQERLPVKKVRGVRKDENDALIRLADALCGWARAAREGQVDMQRLYKVAYQKRIIIEL